MIDAFGNATVQSLTTFGQKVGLRALNIFGLNKDNDMLAYHVRSAVLPGMTFEEKIIDWPGLSFKMELARSKIFLSIKMLSDVGILTRLT